MNAIPPSLSSAGARWVALSEAADVVAALAGIDHEKDQGPPLEGMLEESRGWRRAVAENGIADIAAMMEPGIAALLAVNARGADPRPAARVLWSEYLAARDAVVSVLSRPQSSI